jgi:hypothetical protein
MISDHDSIKIIRHLRKYPKARLLDISRDSGIPLVETYDKYYALKNSGIIRHTFIFNFDSLDLFSHSFIAIEFLIPDPKALQNQEIIGFLRDCKNVNTLSLTDTGLFMEVMFSSTRHYEIFLDSLRRFDIKGLDEYLVTEQISAEKFIPEGY